MTGGLDQLSAAIGRLDALTAERAKGEEAIWHAVDDIRKAIQPIPDLIKKMDAALPHIEEWKRAKANALAIVIFIGTVGAVVGWCIAQWDKVKSLF